MCGWLSFDMFNKMSALNRITKELSQIQKTGLEGFQLTNTEDPFNWFGCLEGPSGSPYAGKKYRVHVRFSQTYPFKAPSVEFMEAVVPEHQHIFNVKKSDEHGNVCMPLLTAEGWGPTMTVRTMVTELRKMMGMP